jgi:hypothetical protein
MKDGGKEQLWRKKGKTNKEGQKESLKREREFAFYSVYISTTE